MSVHTKVCLVVVGAFLASLLDLNECRKLDGYKYPVYTTAFCPRNETEWTERSSALNCNKSNGYTCLPSENFDELLEFCYIVPVEMIQKGFCLYLVKRDSLTNSYSCSHFTQGCHNHSFFSNKIYKYPSCISLGNGCFLAEPSCKRSTTTRPQQSSKLHPEFDNTPVNENDGALFVPILLGIFIPLCILLLSCYYKIRICQRKDDVEFPEEDEIGPLLSDEKHSKNDTHCSHEEEECSPSTRIHKDKINQESQIEKSIFNQWEQDNFCFISTNACKEVEKMIKIRNLVIVAGHSGSGKSAIIQHIALKYREQGWTVKRVKEVKDIVDEYDSSRFQKNKIMCVFNDPLGKESFDEILNNSWQTYEEELNLYLKTAKLLMSCRNHIMFDTRVTRYLVNQLHIVYIDDNKNKISVDEKRQILTKYTSNMPLSDKDSDSIVQVERYFPLLCKLYSSKEENLNKGIKFFTEPVTVLQEEIIGFRNKDKGKYCALILLVILNDRLCVSDLLKDKDTENKFKHTLKLCGLPKRTAPSAIGDNLNSLKDFFVKKIGDTYHFYHDFVMEVTTHMLGTDYSAEIIKYADIGFLRRRVELGNCEEPSYSFTVYLSDIYTEELGERLFTELFGKHLLDVVLNPCLRNEKVIEVMKQKIADHPKYLQMLIETKKITVDKQELDWTSNNLLMTKLAFLELNEEVSPLFALIVFLHTQLSQYCVNIIQQKQIDFINSVPISAMCCNGSVELFNNVFKDHGEKSLEKTWRGLYPIHIVSMFHNYELLNELIKLGVNVNQKTNTKSGCTPLTLAAGNDTLEYGDYNHRESSETRRNNTVQLLLSNGADNNLCKENGASPLYIACLNGHGSTVQLLLINGADINLCTKDGVSYLYLACQNGHGSTVQLLLSNGADINLCNKNGASPLYIACQNGHDSTVPLLLTSGADINLFRKNGASPLTAACLNAHDSTVQLLLSNGADINLCDIDGYSPLNIACFGGHDSTVQLLLSNGADINLCNKNGTSPLTAACLNGQDSTVQVLLSNGADNNLFDEYGFSPFHAACFCGHDSTVQLLLSNGADINLFRKYGASPLYIACQNGHDSTVQLLLSNGADINLCDKNGDSPLYIACQNGHDSTVQLLLSNGADINLCNKNGASPLTASCLNGHDSSVQLLLSNGADINLFDEDGFSPFHAACFGGHDSSVQFLLRNGADINLIDVDGFSPLHAACFGGHDSTVQLLLSNGADINVCKRIGPSPLFLACQNGHDSTVQLLLSNGADINLCTKDRVSPLISAFENRHCKTVNILLNNGADTSLACGWEVNPALVHCFDKQDCTVVYLLQKNNISNNLYNPDSYFSLFVSCQVERVERMIFQE